MGCGGPTGSKGPWRQASGIRGDPGSAQDEPCDFMWTPRRGRVAGAPRSGPPEPTAWPHAALGAQPVPVTATSLLLPSPPRQRLGDVPPGLRHQGAWGCVLIFLPVIREEGCLPTGPADEQICVQEPAESRVFPVIIQLVSRMVPSPYTVPLSSGTWT